ncbi:MAG: hypothetical protein AAGA35_02025 [Patescibacteria group bacterium]
MEAQPNPKQMPHNQLEVPRDIDLSKQSVEWLVANWREVSHFTDRSEELDQFKIELEEEIAFRGIDLSKVVPFRKYET